MATLNVTTMAGRYEPDTGLCASENGIGTSVGFNSLGFNSHVDVASHVLYFRDWNQLKRLDLGTKQVTTLAGGGGPTGYGGLGPPCHTKWYDSYGRGAFANGVGTNTIFTEPFYMVVHPADTNTVYFSTNAVIATYDVPTGAVKVWAGGGDFNNTDYRGWPIGGDADGIGTSALFSNSPCLAVDTVTNSLVVGCLASNAGGVGSINIATKAFRRFAGGSATGANTVRDGDGLAATFQSMLSIAFWDMGGGGGMYFTFDYYYGLLRQIQSSQFGPTNTPTPSITPSQSPTSSQTPSFTTSPSPSPTIDTRTIHTDWGGGGNRAANILPAYTSLNGMRVKVNYTDAIGTAATFGNTLWSIAYSNNNLYVSDAAFHVIRKIDMTTRAVTTLAGDPSTCQNIATSGTQDYNCAWKPYADGIGTRAVFANPTTVRADRAGTYLYVTEWYRYMVRRVDISTGEVTTFAGVLLGHPNPHAWPGCLDNDNNYRSLDGVGSELRTPQAGLSPQ